MLNISPQVYFDLTIGEVIDMINYMAPPEEKKQSKEDLRKALANG